MISRRLRRAVLIGLGTVAGAVLPVRLMAQVPARPDTIRVPARPDTIRVPTPPHVDSMVKNDSLRQGLVPLPPGARRDSTPRDTIKAPLAHAEAPPIFDIGPARIYDRATMFATGALTLSDLLRRVLGISEFTTGWVGAPTVVASLGNLRVVRIFLDGVEMDPLNPREQGVSPVNSLPLLALEEIRIERAAEEVRVYASSWRVNSTDPYTRADVGTGDQSTNLYRAYFGRRYDHGEALQVAAEQFSTQPDRRLPSSSGLHVMGRLGLTHGPWSADLFAERSDVDRAKWVGTGGTADTRDTIAALETRRTTAYARFGNGDPDAGRWIQLLVAAEGYQGSPHVPTTFGAVVDTTPIPDTTNYENQLLVTGGFSLLGARISAAERVRRAGGQTSSSLSGRASFTMPFVGLSVFGETKSALYPGRIDASAKLAGFDRVAIVASASRTTSGTVDRVFGFVTPTPLFSAEGALVHPPASEIDSLYDSTRVTRYALAGATNFRAEAGVRLRDVWVIGGLIRRGATTLLPAAEFDTSAARASALRVEDEATATTIALRGRLYRALYVDAWALRWNDSTGLYRPQYQTRSELYLQTNLLNRFPRGNFGLLASLVHEYQSNARFAVAPAAVPDSVRIAQGFRAVTFKLEIRIQSAVISYQFRNVLQEKFAQVPGFFLPRQTQFYGVRWDFWN